MKRFMITGDWEIDSTNIAIAEPIIDEMAAMFYESKYDQFIHLGDVMREFNPYIVERVAHLLKGFVGPSGQKPIVVLGNHDYDDSGCDRITAIASDFAYPVDAPMILNINNVQFAILPAPNRTAFGASRDIETPRERDASLSTLLENAMLYLKQELITIGRDPADTFFLGHGTLTSGSFASGLRAAGLTWTIPVEQVSEYRASFLGHIHQSYVIDETIIGVGAIAPYTFGDPLMCYANELIVHDDGRFDIDEIPLKRTLLPIEFTITSKPEIRAYRIEHGDNALNCLPAECYDVNAFACFVIDMINTIVASHRISVSAVNERVALKFRVQLPNAEIASFPREHEIRDAINALDDAPHVHRVIVTRERTDGPEIRLTEIDVSQPSRTPLNEYFAQYLDINNIDQNGAIARTAMSLLEEQFIENDWMTDTSFGIEPNSIVVHDFRQWRNFEYDFNATGAIAITGLNALGKSNLLEAIIVALFKRSPASSKRLEDEINHNADKCTIEFIFEASGATYRVRRAIGRKKKGGATCKSELHAQSIDMSWQSVVETSSEIDDKIVSLVGSYDFVTTTFFRTQRDIDRIIDASPTERHDLAIEAHALTRFDDMRKDANALKSSHDEKIRSYDANIATMNTTIEQTREQLDAFETIDMIKSKIDLHNSDIVDCETTLGEIRDHARRDNERRTLLRESRATRTALNDEYDSLIRRVADTIEKLDAIAKHPMPTLPRVTSATLAHECDEFETNRDAIVADLTKLRNEFDAMERERENIRSTMMANRSSIVNMTRSLERIDETPIDGMPCDEPDFSQPPNVGDRNIKSRCPAFAMFTNADKRAELVASIDELTKSNNDRTIELDDINSKIVGFNVDIMKMNNERDAIEKTICDTHQEMRVALALENDMSRWESEQAGLESSRESITSMNVRAEEITNLLVQYATIDDDIKSVDETLTCLNADERKWRDRQLSIERMVTTARSQMARIETYNETITSLNERIDRAQTLRNDAAEEVAAYAILSNAFNRTGGIPYLIMERSFVAIEREANRILNICNAGMTIEIDTMVETAAGDKRDRVDFRFNDSRGNHPLSSASGFQRAVNGMILGAAYTRIGAEFWGLTPAFFVQDEGWDRFHASAYPIARALIDEIARIFTRFYYVTHIDALADTADHHIRVIERDGSPAFILDGHTMKGGDDE